MESYSTNICGKADNYELPRSGGKYDTFRLSDYRMMSRYRARGIDYSGGVASSYFIRPLERKYSKVA